MKVLCRQKSVKHIAEDATKQLIKFNCQLTKLTRSNCFIDTLQLFQQLHSSYSFKPDHYSLSSTLTACANIPDIRAGNQLHAYAINAGLKAYPHVTNSLLSLYSKSRDLFSVNRVFDDITDPDVYSWTTLLSAWAKLGAVDYACQLVDQMPSQDVALWNAIITGCAENACADIGFSLFLKMHRMGVGHDNYTFASVLSLSCLSGPSGFGGQVHSLVIKCGFLGKSSVINALVSMYFKCGDVMDAYEVFEGAQEEVRDQITYNSMINGLVSLGRDDEALLMFREMQMACLKPTELTFLSVLSSFLDEIVCQQVHGQMIKAGYERCTAVSNAAMAMYINHGQLDRACKIFEKLQEKDLVSWNTMITGYAQNGLVMPAMLAYLQMSSVRIEPDEYTIGSLLTCSGCFEFVHAFHALVFKNGLILVNEVANALISSFSKLGDIKQAYEIFSDMYPKNLISWNAVISGFLLNGHPVEGLEQFSYLLKSNIMPDVYTLTIALSICASASALIHGKQVHGYILKHGVFQETTLGNALITMYAKCGILHWSMKVFNSMDRRDIVSWNAIISAFAQYGEGKEAVKCFRAMQDENMVEPDQATFTALLSACSHAGLVDDGINIFNSMVNNYGFEAGVDHFSCVVDLLGRAGYLDEAEELINHENLTTDCNVWWALFSACAAHGNVRLGRIVAGFLLETEQNNPAVYVLLSSIHAAAGQWEEAANIRELMKRVGVLKQPGYSWIRP